MALHLHSVDGAGLKRIDPCGIRRREPDGQSAGSREIALKDKLATTCNGKSKCSQAGDQLVTDPGFLIEIIYTCRDASGGSRQKGPLQIKASATADLNCEE